MGFLRYDGGQTDKQTYKHADHNTSHPLVEEVINVSSREVACLNNKMSRSNYHRRM